jgi:D-glycero-alpha-D-manno-heptose-7-phosphate kinase
VIVTSRTPLRVSLFGGGTDYPAYFERHRGAVIGFAIDKYIYISALRLGSYVDYRSRLS